MAKIVVADDDTDIRDLVVLKLCSSGHDVRAFGDGAAAVDACRADTPDLVVLDVMMPIVGGLEACRQLRAEPALADVPVILLTAKSQESDVSEGYAVGASDYLTKPFSPRELAFRVTALLGGPDPLA